MVTAFLLEAVLEATSASSWNSVARGNPCPLFAAASSGFHPLKTYLGPLIFRGCGQRNQNRKAATSLTLRELRIPAASFLRQGHYGRRRPVRGFDD
mmetsp:Transcript_26971/g.70981  ORF Transcript_26971/g.70981 Transcript_26971/m.70981 type:complete len:96 (+) Transcript_26971:714-1001(+)